MMQLSAGKSSDSHRTSFRDPESEAVTICLLDEIEAALTTLDDSNVGRFAGYLQKLTKNTQFIIITHRRGTMNAADRLYGYYHAGKGVSTLVPSIWWRISLPSNRRVSWQKKRKVFKRLVSGLAKTRDNIVAGFDSIFSGFSSIDEDFMKSWKRF